MGTKIGFIGLGTMGRPMALNLIKAGCELIVYNRTGSSMHPLLAEGARAAASCEEAARGAEVVITMLSDSPVVREAVLGDSGALRGCAKGTVIVDMSTISPAVAEEIARQCAGRGVDFLDAPVSGGESGAVAGTLSIMIGGSERAVERVKPILDILGSTITYMGGPGKGQAAKLCNQVVCGLNILAVCEGLTLGCAAGLDPNVLLDAISGGAAGSWMLCNLSPKMIGRDWQPGFRIDLQQKDLRLAMESASQLNLPLPGTALVQQLFRAAQAAGWGDEGTQALFKVTGALSRPEGDQ